MSTKTIELRRALIAIKLWEEFESSVKPEERDILSRLCKGDCLKLIAADLGMNYSAAHKRLLRWEEKLQVQTREQLLFLWRTLMGDEIQAAADTSPVLTELAAVADYRASSSNLAEREREREEKTATLSQMNSVAFLGLQPAERRD